MAQSLLAMGHPLKAQKALEAVYQIKGTNSVPGVDEILVECKKAYNEYPHEKVCNKARNQLLNVILAFISFRWIKAPCTTSRYIAIA